MSRQAAKGGRAASAAAAAAPTAAGPAAGSSSSRTDPMLMTQQDANGGTTTELDHGLAAHHVYEAADLGRVAHEAYDANGARQKFGSEDEKDLWSVKRRETHKEVERRRRNTINFGIDELAKIVPECDKNKGSIVHKAADYIKYLQRTNLVTIEKWRDEKKETEDKIKSLQDQIERLERDLEAAKRSAPAASVASADAKRRKTDA